MYGRVYRNAREQIVPGEWLARFSSLLLGRSFGLHRAAHKGRSWLTSVRLITGETFLECIHQIDDRSSSWVRHRGDLASARFRFDQATQTILVRVMILGRIE